MPHAVGNGAILGITSEDGVAASKRVVLMDRTNMKVVKKTMSDSDGAYALTGLNHETRDYLLFAVDDDGNPEKNAIVFDYVQPIPAHQGGFFWNNWYLLSMKKEPMCSFIMIPDNNNPLDYSLPYGVGRGPIRKNGGAPTPNIDAKTDGAANLPQLRLISSSVNRRALNHKNMVRKPTPTKVSFEWVLDTSEVESGVAAFVMNTDVKNSSQVFFHYSASIFLVNYNASSHAITLHRHNGASIDSFDGLQEKMIPACSSVLSEELRGQAVHISGSLEYGLSASLYINGVQVVISSLLGTNEYPTKSANQDRMLCTIGRQNEDHRSDLDTNYASFTTSVGAIYSEPMSEAESMALYQSLFEDTIPVITGYGKAVVEGYPTLFYRLHDIDSEDLYSDALRPDNKNLTSLRKANAIGISHSTDTIVVGGSGTVFNGGALLSHGYAVGSPISPRFMTVEFMARPDDVAGIKSVFIQMNGSRTPFFEVQITAANKWALGWRENGASQGTTFSTNIDFTNIHLYTFTINKASLEAMLYIDGVLTETVVVSGVGFDTLISWVTDYEYVSIGGYPSLDLTSVANPYKGYLAEVALYPAVLSPETIQYHYDAKSII